MNETNLSFYHPIEIGELKLKGNLFLAPIAGYSDVIFRSLCADEGASFTYTEMVSTEALVRLSQNTHLLMEKSDREEKYAIQLFGSSPQTMVKAALMIVENYAPACIDVNAGCPMPKITKTGAGSALLSTPKLLFDILSELVKALEPLPVTVKIRSGKTCDAPLWKEAARVCVEAGVKAITMHPRSQAQCYSGVSKTSLIGELKEEVGKYGVKVFGSGDLFTAEDAKKMFELTHCDGVMFARGAMGNPFIFRQTKELLQNGNISEIDIKDKIETARKELFLLCKLKGEKLGCLEMRKRISPYIKGLENASERRKELVQCSSLKEYENVLAKILSDVQN
ncbi:MAG: tRNA dihydrouridine synthase DusB [Treponema sp.]